MNMMEPEQFRQKYFPKKPLLSCPVCKKPGYEYIKMDNGHRYAYTIHYNEPPIGIRLNGKRLRANYRICSTGGRLYDTIHEGIITKQKKIARAKFIICPKCQKKGRRDEYKQYGILHAVVVHERIKNKKKTWGKDKSPQYRRCFLGKVEVTDAT